MKTQDINKLLRKKCCDAIYHLKAANETRSHNAFDEIINGPDFKEASRVFKTMCEEACRDESLRQKLYSAIASLESGFQNKDHVEFREFVTSAEFRKLINLFENAYKKIFGDRNDFKKGYEKFLSDTENLAGKRPGWLSMSLKIAAGAIAVATVGIGGVVVLRRKRKKENDEK